MPPRVAYWTTSFEPEMEAVASEVACLRRAFPGSIAWGISSRDWKRFSSERGYCFHDRFYRLFQTVTHFAQGAFHINHLFGGLGDWFHLKAVKKHPIVMTVAVDGTACEPRLLHKVDCFVVEWPAARDKLKHLGVDESRIRLVFPPVDTDRFQPAPRGARTEGFTVLFASSPDSFEWLEGRGLNLLLDAAELCREIRFLLVWRPWGDSLAHIKGAIEKRGLQNVKLAVGKYPNMESFYQQAHATIFPYRQMDKCKPSPNSLIESLACGRPVIVTPKVGLAETVAGHGAGVVCEETAGSVAQAIERLRSDWNSFSKNSRRAAEQLFSQRQFLQSYAQLYQEIL